MKLPVQITPCPIFQSIVEIRFDSPVPQDAIFGILYKEFKDDLPNATPFPILQIPEALRLQDPSLEFKPYHKIRNEKYSMNIGPKVLSIINEGEYMGWTSLSSIIKDSFYRANRQGVIGSIKRLGIRYLNYFDFNIFEKINLKLFMNDKPFESKKTIIRTAIQSNKFLSNLQISNNAEVMLKDKGAQKGSIIDIDIYKDDQILTIDTITKDLIEEGHAEEKKIFFGLLDKEYLGSLNPIY